MRDLFYHDRSKNYHADEKDVRWAEMEIIMTRDNNIPEIDFVITWVDGNDPDWQKQKMEYSMQPDLSQTGFVVWSVLHHGCAGYTLLHGGICHPG